MKRVSISGIKNSPPFKKRDLILYGVTVLFVLVAFLSSTLHSANDAGDGFKIAVRGEVVFTYVYGGSATVIASEGVDVSYDAEAKTVTVYVNDADYNVIKIDDAKHVAAVVSTNCRNGYCLKMNGVVFCQPHGLSVIPYGVTEDVVSGGVK